MDLETMKKKNLDGAILFIQQEHSMTLKALHEEISNLQKKCSELTFQVAMSNTSISQEDEFRDKCQSLEKELSNEQNQVRTLETENHQKDKRINLLEKMLKSHEHKIKDAKESHKQIMQNLQTQLNSKSDMVALLNNKLHQLRQQATQQRKVSLDRGSRNSSASSSTEESPRMRHPAPPKDGIAHRHRRRSSQEVEYSITHVPVPPVKPPARHGSGRRLSNKPQTPEHIPDPTPFLSRDEDGAHGLFGFAKREHTILPPISHSVMNEATHKADNLTFFQKSSVKVKQTGDSSPEVDVETLAMSPVTRKNHHLRQAQDYNSSN